MIPIYTLIILRTYDHPNDPQSTGNANHKEIKQQRTLALDSTARSHCGRRRRRRWGRVIIVNDYRLLVFCPLVVSIILGRTATMYTYYRFIVNFFSAFWAKHIYLQNKKCANQSQRTEKRKLQLSPNKSKKIWEHCFTYTVRGICIFTKFKNSIRLKKGIACPIRQNIPIYLIFDLFGIVIISQISIIVNIFQRNCSNYLSRGTHKD